MDPSPDRFYQRRPKNDPLSSASFECKWNTITGAYLASNLSHSNSAYRCPKGRRTIPRSATGEVDCLTQEALDSPYEATASGRRTVDLLRAVPIAKGRRPSGHRRQSPVLTSTEIQRIEPQARGRVPRWPNQGKQPRHISVLRVWITHFSLRVDQLLEESNRFVSEFRYQSVPK